MKYMLVTLASMVTFMPYANSQIPYTIRGVVADEFNRPLPGASVVLNPAEKGTVADGAGTYSFTALPPGTYVLKASFVGYRSYSDTLVLQGNVIRDIRLERALQNLQEVVITGDYAEARNREESLNLEIVNDRYLKQNLGGSLMKSLERLPGVDAMGIGSGQSKPVIRGLGFNRVVVVENGIKHQGQQWGSDHGLEIDQYAVERAEVIKGPSSMMYGSDAMGGVVLLNPSPVPERNSWGGSADLTANTNNFLLGGSLKLHIRRDKWYAGARGTYLDYGDYRVPADSVDIYSYRVALHRSRLRNTAGREGSLHLESGWLHKGFSSRFFISGLGNKTGFFANAHGLEPRRVNSELHDRSSRDIMYPYHQVSHWKAINRTAWTAEHHVLEAELAVQKNFRQEWSQYVNHGYMPAEFPDTLPFPSDLERQFEKFTYSGNVRSIYRTGGNLKIISGLQTEYQDNRIDGRGFIIPAFEQFGWGAFVIVKQDIGSSGMLSGGLRYDAGRITTSEYHDWFHTPPLSSPGSGEEYIQRAEVLDRRFSNLTWTVGYNLNLNHLDLKVNAGKSFRMPLAKELAANGVNYHHFSYEVGDPGLSPETSYQLDAGIEWNTRFLAVGVSPFISFFPNYIYLNPGYEHDWLYGSGNQVYTYTQSEVLRHGGELHAHIEPVPALRLGVIGEYTYSLQLTGEKEGFGLPFSPPPSILLHLKYSRDRLWKFGEPYASLDVRLASRQDRIVPPEEPTPGYQVVYLGFGANLSFGRQVVYLSIQVQNLFDRKYFDHTSYYRLVNVPEAGRSIILSVSVPFSGSRNNNVSQY